MSGLPPARQSHNLAVTASNVPDSLDRGLQSVSALLALWSQAGGCLVQDDGPRSHWALPECNPTRSLQPRVEEDHLFLFDTLAIAGFSRDYLAAAPNDSEDQHP